MEKGNWFEIRKKLQLTLEEMFYKYDLENLDCYEKRKIIFDYLCDNVSYDYELLKDIRDFNESKKRVSRNPFLELSNVIDKKIGVCNAISQYYKLLLQEVGITSYCVICDDGTPVKHQLNLVYDDCHGMYSFDDITSVIVGRGTKEEYFDYDLESANFYNQGNVEVYKNKKWFVLPNDYINYLIGKEKESAVCLDDLPNNISSIKLKTTKNIKS